MDAYAHLAHLNNDHLLDIAYINAGSNGLGQMNIHFQQTIGFREQADWQSDLDSSGQLQLIDMNSDGSRDILRLSGDGNEWTGCAPQSVRQISLRLPGHALLWLRFES